MTHYIQTRIKQLNSSSIKAAGLVAILAFLLPACAAVADEPPANEAAAAQVTLDVERFALPQNAETEHFVGAVDDELFIGIAVPGVGANGDESRTVAVYLCDSQDVSQWIVGQVTGQQATLITDEASIEVTLDGANASGAVTLGGGEPRPFTAELASGEAGIYRTEWSQGGVNYQIDWIVLADGRQRGPLDGKGNDVLIVDPN